jgi:predicted AAA+ superfamily ATPase
MKEDHKKPYIKRPSYFEKVAPYIGKDLIKVFVGQRRSGKSYFLFQLMDELRGRGVEESDIIYINKELHEFGHIRTAEDLVRFVGEQRCAAHQVKLFIDEVQEIEDFPRALRSLHAGGEVEIYCTGSNAQMLSSDIANTLGGRYIAIEIFPLSYEEFLEFQKLSDRDESLTSYIKYGGLPYLIHLELTDAVAYEYIRAVYNTILLKDIVTRFQIRNPSFLKTLVEYLADNVGSLVSAHRISDFLKSQKIHNSPNLVLDYLQYLEAAFLVFEAPRSGIIGKKIFEVNDKWYFGDLGIRHGIIGYRQQDINKDIENLAYLHMRRAGYEVTVGQMGEKEIDFVCERSGERIYIQCAYLIGSEAVHAREFGNLLAIPDNYRKIVVSMDDGAGGSVKGVEHMRLRTFLLQKF